MAVWDATFTAGFVPQRGPVATQVVFCDFDGPIVDVSERYYRTYRRGLLEIDLLYRQTHCAQLPIKPLTKADFWHQKQNRISDLRIAVHSGVPESWFERYMRQVEVLVNHANLLRWDTIQPSAKAALRCLRQANMRLVIVTLRQSHQVNALLRAQGLAHLVDDVYGAESSAAAYQNRTEHKRELLSQAIEQQQKQGYRTQGSWMIGDTEADILAAQSAGLQSAALECGIRSRDYLEAFEPTRMYGSLLSATQAITAETQLQVA